MTLISQEAKGEFTPFLETALGRSRNIEIFQLAGDASARRYFRVVAGDESWVLMVWEPFKNDGNYPFLSVREHFAKHGVAVPQIIDMAPDKGLVLLEDLGDLTLERKFWENQDQSSSLSYYKQAIDELIKMHYPSTFDRAECTAFKVEFDVEKLFWEMNYGREHLLKNLCQINMPDTMNHELDRAFMKVCTTLHQEPKFIAHRDYHSRNIMLKLGRARIIDFQDARLGPVQYDLVSLLRDSYVHMSDAMAETLIAYYLERRNEIASDNVAASNSAAGISASAISAASCSLPPISLEHFHNIYDLQTVQRCFKACGSFASFYNLRKDTRYLKYLTPTLQTVKSALLKFSDLKIFHDVLQDHGIFERDFGNL
jgi:aminoglycoside/choline kinase family phosphotransferase